MTLKPVAEHLSSLLNRKVTFLEDCVGDSVLNQVNKANNEIFLCENVRFHAEEEGKYKDDQGNKVKCSKEAVTAFRNQLTKLGNVYVNDAFGTAHRAHSSVVGIAHKYRVAGLLMQKEIQHLGTFL
jgi:phosphoglycerate kinase